MRFTISLLLLTLSFSLWSQTIVKTYFDEVSKIVKEEFETSDGLTKNGSYIKFLDTGGKEIEGAYVNNKKEGKWFYYHENGNIKIDAIYKTDLPDGHWQYFYHSGAIKITMNGSRTMKMERFKVKVFLIREMGCIKNTIRMVNLSVIFHM